MPKRPTDCLPLSACVQRGLYRIHARNFRLGVFDGSTGFIGVRTKWGDVYLFTELHWDASETYGTVKPIELLPDELPAEIQLDEKDPALFEWLKLMVEKYDS